MRLAKLFAILSICIMTAGCSWFGGGEETDNLDTPEQTIYDEAISALKADNYPLAIEKLQLLEARYPFGQYSEQAQLELIFAYHKNGEAEAAKAAADRFIRLHPNHPNLDYALYLKGLTAFNQDKSIFEDYLPIDESTRDPGNALDSFNSFDTLIKRFPNSQYAPDSQKRMVYLKNRLAQYEIHVARYYVRREAWLAAANRGRYVVENYQETPLVPEALSIMVLGYNQLQLPELAADAQAVLDANFPGYKTNIARAKKESLLSSATFGLFGEGDQEPANQQPASQVEEDTDERSWFSIMTFGVFDDDDEEIQPAQ